MNRETKEARKALMKLKKECDIIKYKQARLSELEENPLVKEYISLKESLPEDIWLLKVAECTILEPYRKGNNDITAEIMALDASIDAIDTTINRTGSIY